MTEINVFLLLLSAGAALGSFSVNNTESALESAGILGWTKSRIVCYYGQWGNVGQIPGDKCTHLIYSFISLNENNWRWKFLGNGNDQKIREFVNLRNRFPNLKLMIAVGGGSEGGAKFSQMAEYPQRRQTFIKSLVEFMNTYKFDGLDMDWEFPGIDWAGGRPIDKENFVKFMREIRTSFNQQGKNWELTMAVAVTEYGMKVAYDIPPLCEILDAVHLMTYDMRGTWDTFADVHSMLDSRPSDAGGYKTLNTRSGALRWNQAGCPRFKLIVGVPFYGYKFVLRDAGRNRPGDAIDQDASKRLPDGGAMSYAQICRELKNGGWIRTFDDTVKCPYMTRGKYFVGYEDTQSLKIKMDFIRNEGYGGGMVWAINHDDFDGACGPRAPMITLMHNNLKDYWVRTP